MKRYKVIFTIEVDADNREDALRLAELKMADPLIGYPVKIQRKYNKKDD